MTPFITRRNAARLLLAVLVATFVAVASGRFAEGRYATGWGYAFLAVVAGWLLVTGFRRVKVKVTVKREERRARSGSEFV